MAHRAPSPRAPRVVLIGPPGSGKSTVAAHIARMLGVRPRDTDKDVEAVAGKPISDVFIDDGEAAFRELEHAAVLAALSTHRGVLALGGGAVLHPETQAALRAYRDAGGVVVFLDVSLSAAAPRVGFNTSRPLLLGNPRARWQQLMEERRAIYEELATVRVLTDGATPFAVAEQIRMVVLARAGRADAGSDRADEPTAGAAPAERGAAERGAAGGRATGEGAPDPRGGTA